MNKKKLVIIVISIVVALAAIVGIVFAVSKSNNNNNDEKQVSNNNEPNNLEVEIKEEEKVDIIDVNSTTRPYAISVNNTAVAVKVQEGLNKAYLVYEIPTEGNTSRLLALYKDIQEDLTIGTIRSARHNFIDFALESDAIFVCFGWSHYAEDDLKNGSIDYIQGLYGGPFWRNNPENLASEHTAYTNTAKLDETVKSKKFNTTSNDTILLNYNVSDVELSVANETKIANTVTIPYGYAPQIASFKYNEETKMYTRYENGNECKDHNTKDAVTTKNIIVQKVNYKMCDDNYYWDLETTGTGKGYYITNGYAVPIIWSKSNRSSKTKYTYEIGVILNGQDVSGQEISVSDGRTWIEIQTNSQKLTIE